MVPEALAEPILTLEGVKLEIVEFGEGESKHIAAVYVLELKSLLAADLVYNQAHLCLQERHLESWLVRLNELETFAKDRVVRSIQGTERPQVLNSLGSTRLHPRFRGRNKDGDAKTVEQQMLAKYPEYHVRQFLTVFSIPSYFPSPSAP